MGKSEEISEYQILENGRFGYLLQINESSRLSDGNIQEEKILLNIAPKRFKEGDIVEVRKENHVELGIVHEAPQDSDRYNIVFYVKTQNGDKYYSSNPLAVNVFAPCLQVPEDIQMKLRECLQRKKNS